MPILFNRYYPPRNLCFFFIEGFLIFLSVMLVNLMFIGFNIFLIDFFDCARQALTVTIVFQLCLYFFDLYDLGNDISLFDTFTRIIQAFGVGCISLAIIYYFVKDLMIPTLIFWVGFLVICLSVFSLRASYFRILRKRMFAQSIVVLGTGRLAADISREIEGRRDSGYRILGFVGSNEPAYNPNHAPVHHRIEEYCNSMYATMIDRIIVAADDRRGTVPIQKLIQCKMQGIMIDQGVDFFERISGKLLVEKLDPSWIFFSDGFSFSRWKRWMKRTLDIAVSLPMLILSLPLLALAATVIKIESAGPVLYRQDRVGENSRVFQIIKLRSMRQDAEKNGAVWAAVNDDRVTRFGSFMRKMRIDELPQLWNVLKGEMSIVGPRPERPVFVEQLVKILPYYNIRHAAKPGVTGWAQVCYPYGASTEDALCKLEYDLYYLKNSSLALDLFIILKTAKTVLFQKGSR
ncbi:MAG: TIGR03013 family PEP-CTERM/XrtA system glycosyltransferase [Desulfobulbaceae bacterium]|nr:MAG: TIGR03013 family PEP-CTERM/XrtA system glycosyltransferase [Desulfobulbaceae bacterium]